MGRQPSDPCLMAGRRTVIARVSPGGGGGPYRVSHQDALRRSADLRGVVGGTSPPPAPAGDPRSVAPKGRLALAPLACLSQPADGFRHASLRAARNGARLAVAGKLLGLMAASLTDSEGDGDPSRLGGRVALCRAAAFGPTRTGDRRSWAILRPYPYRRSSILGDPTARNFPEMPLECPQAVSEPVAPRSPRAGTQLARRAWLGAGDMTVRLGAASRNDHVRLTIQATGLLRGADGSCFSSMGYLG